MGLPWAGARTGSLMPRSALNVRKGRGHRGVGHIRGNPDLTDAFRQHPVNLSSHGFLVAGEKPQDFFRAEVVNGGQRTCLPHQARDTFTLSRIKEADKFRQPGYEEHTPADRLAVQKTSIPCNLL